MDIAAIQIHWLKNQYSLADGVVACDEGELNTSTDSDAELVRPDTVAAVVVVVLSLPGFEINRVSPVLVGALVTAGALPLFRSFTSKNDPVNDPHKLLADAALPTVDKIGLLADCLTTRTFFALTTVSGEIFSSKFVDGDAVLIVSSTSSSSSVISNALSMVFWASLRADLARLAIPVASNQLIFTFSFSLFESRIYSE